MHNNKKKKEQIKMFHINAYHFVLSRQVVEGIFPCCAKILKNKYKKVTLMGFGLLLL